MKGDQVAFVADPAEMIAPVLIEAHADGWQLIAGAELRRPHQGQRLRLQDALAIEFAAIEQRLAEAAHVRRARRDAACADRVEDLKADRRLGGVVAIALRRQIGQ